MMWIDSSNFSLLVFGVVVSCIFSATACVLAFKAHKAVNSRMDEFKRIFQDLFMRKGADAEIEKQRVRDAAGRAGLVVEAETKAADLRHEASATAAEVRHEASETAAQVLAEAHRVSENDKQ
jgi:Skp family chaperone for outer membrane proteins